jgi:hypothetical protein
MKKSRVIIICLLVFVLGSALGYYIGHRKGLCAATGLMFSDDIESAQKNLEFETRAYLRCLNDLDSGNVTNLHEFALGHVRFYVSDVQQLQSEGYTWAPHIPQLYSNATVYVAEHARK